MPIVLNGTTGITNDSGYTGDGVSFADSTPANTLVTTSGGNVGIGTSSPNAPLQVNGASGSVALIVGNTGETTRLEITATSNTGATLDITDSGANRNLMFAISGTERARIDSSGNLLVGKTASSAAKFEVSASLEVAAFQNTSGTGLVRFYNSGATTIGYIQWSGTSTSYVTSSDYRLKHDIQPMTGALEKVAALKPVTYKWNADDSQSQGFIAHELQEVVPECVTGEKDAVDAEGKPVYQGIDTSFLVATLTAAIQEQQALIESLTARVVALEGA